MEEMEALKISLVLCFVLFLRRTFSLFFQDRYFSLCSSGCPGNPYVDQAGPELTEPASATHTLGLKVYATTPGRRNFKTYL